MSFKPEVTTGSDPKFYGNALAFATYEEAYANAHDLAWRWMLVKDYRAIESTDPVTHTYVDGVLGDAPKDEAVVGTDNDGNAVCFNTQTGENYNSGEPA